MRKKSYMNESLILNDNFFKASQRLEEGFLSAMAGFVKKIPKFGKDKSAAMKKLIGSVNNLNKELDKLEKTAGLISYIHIEGMWQEFDEASKAIYESNPDCINMVKERVKSGSKYKPVEDEALYKTLIDWTRIAQLGFISEDVKKIVEENHMLKNASHKLFDFDLYDHNFIKY